MVDMVDYDRELIETYVRWLYDRKLHMSVKVTQSSGEYNLLANLYDMGEKLLDAYFQNTIVSSMITLIRQKRVGCHRYPGNQPTHAIYAGTVTASPARRLLIHSFAKLATKSWVGDIREQARILRDTHI